MKNKWIALLLCLSLLFFLFRHDPFSFSYHFYL